VLAADLRSFFPSNPEAQRDYLHGLASLKALKYGEAKDLSSLVFPRSPINIK
jgi:hypothetical protein